MIKREERELKLLWKQELNTNKNFLVTKKVIHSFHSFSDHLLKTGNKIKRGGSLLPSITF